jgi:hypothetical protein
MKTVVAMMHISTSVLYRTTVGTISLIYMYRALQTTGSAPIYMYPMYARLNCQMPMNPIALFITWSLKVTLFSSNLRMNSNR